MAEETVLELKNILCLGIESQLRELQVGTRVVHTLSFVSGIEMASIAIVTTKDMQIEPNKIYTIILKEEGGHGNNEFNGNTSN